MATKKLPAKKAASKKTTSTKFSGKKTTAKERIAALNRDAEINKIAEEAANGGSIRTKPGRGSLSKKKTTAAKVTTKAKSKATASKAAGPGRKATSKYDDSAKITVLNKDHGLRGTRGELMTGLLKCKTVGAAMNVQVGNYKTGNMYLQQALDMKLIKIAK